LRDRVDWIGLIVAGAFAGLWAYCAIESLLHIHQVGL
jgi:hypothetical protein